MTTHHEERFLPHSPQQMFDLVADVARYPEFLPWTAAARIRSREPLTGQADSAGEVMEADLVISFKLFRERFGSRVTLLPAQGQILTHYLDGPLRDLKSVWRFSQGANGPNSCNVTFDVDFEFRNPILRGVIGLVFTEAMTRVVRAFETRAKALYGAS
ncbi:MAG: type II toxin-antitoxin system RatA family toxin [Pseudomonadota bacterium]